MACRDPSKREREGGSRGWNHEHNNRRGRAYADSHRGPLRLAVLPGHPARAPRIHSIDSRSCPERTAAARLPGLLLRAAASAWPSARTPSGNAWTARNNAILPVLWRRARSGRIDLSEMR